jgi:hypothetical protein
VFVVRERMRSLCSSKIHSPRTEVRVNGVNSVSRLTAAEIGKVTVCCCGSKWYCLPVPRGLHGVHCWHPAARSYVRCDMWNVSILYSVQQRHG